MDPSRSKKSSSPTSIEKESTSKEFDGARSDEVEHMPISKSEITSFARKVAGKKYLSSFIEKLEVEKLENLKRKGLKLTTVAGILEGAGEKANEAFNDLYEALFEKIVVVKTRVEFLKDRGVDFDRFSSMTYGAGAEGKKTFVDLYNVMFEDLGGGRTRFSDFRSIGIDV